MEDSLLASTSMTPLAFRTLLAACAVLPLQSFATMNIGPVDCKPGNVDNTCMGPLHSPTGRTPGKDPSPPDSFSLAGMPPSGYWYFGYDFLKADDQQSALPQFVNRSGSTIELTFSFTIPTGSCGNACLPGLEFYKGSSKIYKIDPTLQVNNNTARGTLVVMDGESYSWIIGLWQAINPLLTISDQDGQRISLTNTGLSPEPDVARLVPGSTTSCQCPDGYVASCNFGDHYSNGLLGSWSITGALSRSNAWNNCPFGGS